MEISKNDSRSDPLSWLERADRVGQVCGSSPHGPTIVLMVAVLYILQSQKSGKFYIGSTDDLDRRISEQ
jgi:hypothetical protein